MAESQSATNMDIDESPSLINVDIADTPSTHSVTSAPQEIENSTTHDVPCVELLFAEDLMSFVMQKRNLLWQSSAAAYRFRETVSTAFIREIGLAVVLLSERFKLSLENQYIHYRSANFDSGEDFKFAARGLAMRCFLEGYNGPDFMKYCSKVTALAAMYFKDGIKDAPDVAVSGIVETLTKNFKLEFDFLGRWEVLYKECSKLLGGRIVGER